MLAREAKHLDGRALLGPGAEEAIREHARAAFPHEALGHIRPDGSYGILANRSPRPEVSAYAAPEELGALIVSGQFAALVHSHPNGPDCPSENDMAAQVEMEVPFVLLSTDGSATTDPFAWGDQLLDSRPIVGRAFRHGVDDCYECVRAHYLREEGAVLPSYPRNWDWWCQSTPGGKDLYSRFFREAGFYPIDIQEVRPGDAWLAVVGRDAVKTNTPNHAGVVLEGGLTLHHPSSGLPFDSMRLSKSEPLARWTPHVSHWLRRSR